MDFDVMMFSGVALWPDEAHGCDIVPWCGVTYEIVFMRDGTVRSFVWVAELAN